MEALSLGHSLHRYPPHTHHHHHRKKPCSRSQFSPISCGSPGPAGTSDSGEETKKKEKKKKEKKGRWGPAVGLYREAEKAGRRVRESLLQSPKQKGDWKDLVLMSFSFAVYVYISQRLVCAYCAWTSMVNHF